MRRMSCAIARTPPSSGPLAGCSPPGIGVGRDEFPLTQQFLAQILGVRRPTVSEIASRLQEAGLIRYTRGIVTIADRPGLQRTTCDCYRIVKAEFDRLTGD